MTSALDPARVVRHLAAVAADTDDERSRQMLETLRLHMLHEGVTRSSSDVMSLYGVDPRISTWGSSGKDWGARGRDAVAALVEHDCSQPGSDQLEFACETVVVDSDCIAVQGVLRRRFPGTLLSDLGDSIDPAREYEWTTEMAAFYRFDADARITSVDTYASGDVLARVSPVV